MRVSMLALMLLALAVFARADDTDPEPPVSPVSPKQLIGKWASARRFTSRQELTYWNAERYTFGAEKVTYTHNSVPQAETMTWQLDRKQPFVITMTLNNKEKETRRFFVRMVRGELHLALDHSQ